MERKLLYTFREGAEILSCNYWTLFRLYKAKKLKAVRLGNRALRIPVTEIERLAGVEVKHD